MCKLFIITFFFEFKTKSYKRNFIHRKSRSSMWTKHIISRHFNYKLLVKYNVSKILMKNGRQVTESTRYTSESTTNLSEVDRRGETLRYDLQILDDTEMTRPIRLETCLVFWQDKIVTSTSSFINSIILLTV